MKGGSRSRLAALLLGGALLAAILCLTGCQDFFNGLFDTAAPTGVHASDGEYPDSIQVSWGAPSLSSDKWKDKSIDGYEVSWSGPTSGSAFAGGTSYSIRTGLVQAAYYTITVKTRVSGSWEGSAQDTGFALDTQDLLWYDGGSSYQLPQVSDWYLTMLQKGFTYTFTFPGTGSVSFCPYKSLDPVYTTEIGSSVSWTCDQDGEGHKFFIKVMPSAWPSSVTASYGF
jgi:hypothetical protein